MSTVPFSSLPQWIDDPQALVRTDACDDPDPPIAQLAGTERESSPLHLKLARIAPNSRGSPANTETSCMDHGGVVSARA